MPEFKAGDIADVYFSRVDQFFGRLHEIYFIIDARDDAEGTYVELCKDMLGNDGFMAPECIPLNEINKIIIYNKKQE